MRKHLRRLGGLILATLLLPGAVTLLSSTTAAAQRRGRVIIVRRPIYRPFYRPWGWRRGPNDYYSRYGHYIFNNSDKALNEG